MNKIVLYIHGKGGTPNEAEHYKSLFHNCNVIGLDYHSETPWNAKKEFPYLFHKLCDNSDSVILIANSIGAYFAVSSLQNEKIERAFFISPIVNMERLIYDMLSWSGFTEKDLCERKEIKTSFGETLSWEYLCYVKKQKILWNVPTDILYGEKDNLTSYDTIHSFAEKFSASLTVMTGGEHWFHTPEQMRFLDEWMLSSANKK